MMRRVMAAVAGALMFLAGGCGSEDGPRAERRDPGSLGAVAEGTVATQAASEVRASPSAAAGTAPTASTSRVGAGAAAVDPCSLLTVEEAKPALGGGEVAAPRRGQFGGAESCHFSLQGTSAPQVAIVWVETSVSAADARQEFEADRRFDDGQPLAGVGDAAYVTMKMSKKAVVLSGARMVSILLMPPSRMTPEDVQARLTDMGKAAAARLR